LQGLAILVALAGVQVVFWILQWNQAQSVLKGIEGLLRREAAIVNPYLMAATLTDLESLGSISCIRIQQTGQTGEQPRVFFDSTFKTDCSSRPWLLQSQPLS